MGVIDGTLMVTAQNEHFAQISFQKTKVKNYSESIERLRQMFSSERLAMAIDSLTSWADV